MTSCGQRSAVRAVAAMVRTTDPTMNQAMPTACKEVTIINERGLHARPAMEFVDVANRFQSEVRVFSLGEEKLEVDGKSIMQMMTLAAVQGTPLRIEANGEDAEQAVTELAQLIDGKFGEE